eukprot:2205836-Alexandrium_andersonii.AAC.1
MLRGPVADSAAARLGREPRAARPPPGRLSHPAHPPRVDAPPRSAAEVSRGRPSLLTSRPERAYRLPLGVRP